MRIPLFRGRDFRWTDATATGLKIILNQSAAKLLFARPRPCWPYRHQVCGRSSHPHSVRSHRRRRRRQVRGSSLRTAADRVSPYDTGRRPACRVRITQWYGSMALRSAGGRGANPDKPDGPGHPHPGHDVDVQDRRRLSQRRAHDGSALHLFRCLRIGGHRCRTLRHTCIRDGPSHQRDWYSHGARARGARRWLAWSFVRMRPWPSEARRPA